MRTISYVLAIISIAVFTACHKSDDPQIKKTIVGSWTNNIVDDAKPTFTADSIKWNNYESDSIRISSDTIFICYRYGVPDPSGTFSISNNNDTLRITSFFDNETSTYWRVK